MRLSADCSATGPPYSSQHGRAQPAEVAAEAARDVLLDPLRRGGVIPSPRPGRVLVIPGGPGRLVEGGVVKQPEPPLVPLPVECRLRPNRPPNRNR